jgi:hypothetical protein
LRDKTTTAATSHSASFIKQGRKTQKSKWLLDLTIIYNYVTGSLVLNFNIDILSSFLGDVL